MAEARRTAPVARRAVLALPFLVASRGARAGGEGMVAAANPLAAEAGVAMLRQGGSAADAAVATALMLSVVEPYAGGLGGGGVALLWMGGGREPISLEGLSMAPLRAMPVLTRNPDGSRVGWDELPGTGREVAVPQLLALLGAIHAEAGRLRWSALVEPAIRAAREGFVVAPGLAASISEEPGLHGSPSFRELFLPGGRAPASGGRLRNAGQAALLEAVADRGPGVLGGPPWSEAILDAVRTARLPSLMEASDLAAAAARRRRVAELVVFSRRCLAAGAPANGGIAALQTLGLLERAGAGRLDPLSVEGAHRMIVASRLAASDRRAWIGDPDFGPVPEEELLDTRYLERRAALVDPDRARDRYEAGSPGRRRGALPVGGDATDRTGTSHVSVIDRDGRAVSLTITNNRHWGSGLVAAGLVLNNGMGNFEPVPSGHPNRTEPRKRPATSMAPMLVAGEDGRALLAFGSGGGSRIIDAVVRTALGVLARGMGVAEAVALPHVGGHVGGVGELERDTRAEALGPALERLGHRIRIVGMNTGTHAVLLRNGAFEGGADPRRDGVALRA